MVFVNAGTLGAVPGRRDELVAHQSSLQLPEVQASIAAARPLLSGVFGGFTFDVVGSPLRD